jgi:biopolymer transport protein ExbD
MAMTAQTANGEVLSDINTTPLIDVMLVLLTLLIITLPMQTHAVKIDLPHGTPPPQQPIPTVMLEVDFDGAPIWNGWRIDDATLDQKLLEASRSAPQPEIHIMANRLARYDSVVKVMVKTQRHGLYKMGLIDTQAY